MSSWLLTNPAGLFALAALAVPVLIHLLSRSRGRRVPVGNIELFRGAQKRRVTQLRLTQWLLLLLRCLVLALAALLLAGLARPGLNTLPGHTVYVTEGRGNADIDDAVAAAAASASAPIVAASNRKAIERVVTIEGGWPWLAERLATVQHPDGVTVLTLESAADRPPDGLVLPGEVSWQHAGTATPRPPARRAVVIAFDPDRQQDARMLAAALQASDETYALTLQVRLQQSDTPLPSADAVIWLSRKPVPDLGLDLDADLDLDGGEVSPLLLTDDPSITTPWHEEAGRAGLRRAGAQRVHYAGRLGLRQDGIAWQDGFPDLLTRLLLGEALWRTGTTHAPLLGEARAAGAAASDPGDQGDRRDRLDGGPSRPLTPWLALLMALLFLAERWLAERWRQAAARGTR